MEEFLQRETVSLRLTEEYAKAVSLPKILNFLEQELAYRMWRAQEQGLLYREQPFVLGIDAKRLDPDLPEGEKVLIQGIIDVFFIEDGEIVLLDYKTDVIDSLEALWNRYNVQILIMETEVETMYAMEFAQVGENIQHLLDERGMTQQNLAEALGISKQVVNKIIKGNKAINVKEIAEIAQILGVSADDLLMVRDTNTAPDSLSFMGTVQDEDTLQKINRIREAIDEIHMLEGVLHDK